MMIHFRRKSKSRFHSSKFNADRPFESIVELSISRDDGNKVTRAFFVKKSGNLRKSSVIFILKEVVYLFRVKAVIEQGIFQVVRQFKDEIGEEEKYFIVIKTVDVGLDFARLRAVSKLKGLLEVTFFRQDVENESVSDVVFVSAVLVRSPTVLSPKKLLDRNVVAENVLIQMRPRQLFLAVHF